MRPSEALEKHRETIRAVVQAHRGTNPRVFGSAAFGEDEEGSDLDLLIDATPGLTLLDMGAILHELEQKIGVSIDIVTTEGLPESFREVVLSEAVPV